VFWKTHRDPETLKPRSIDNEDLQPHLSPPLLMKMGSARAKILQVHSDHLEECRNDKLVVKLRPRLGNDEFDELVAYNEMMDAISEDTTEDDTWKFQTILKHEGPFL
jgi:hypothetical protein